MTNAASSAVENKVGARPDTTVTSHSRGYLTTPAELREIAEKAKAGVEPYRSAVRDVIEKANETWTRSPLSGEVTCQRQPEEGTPSGTSMIALPGMSELKLGIELGSSRKESKGHAPKQGGPGKSESPEEPRYISEGGVTVYAKALAYNLTGKDSYAADVVTAIQGLLGVNSFGHFGNTQQPERQCQLNLSWYIPGFIRAADLVEDYPGWKSTKPAFQKWLATVVYPTTSFTAEVAVSNWGAAATNLSTYIADYLYDRPDLTLVSYNVPGSPEATTSRTPAQAYEHAIQLALRRMNGTRVEGRGGSSYSCDVEPATKSMIRPEGGMPDDLRRGSTGCSGIRILADDKSNMYSQTHLQNLIAQAELLRRRGDLRIYGNIANDSPVFQYVDSRGEQHTVTLPAGRGSLRKAILFVLSQQRARALRSACEVAYAYYGDSAMLNAVTATRPNTGNRGMAFETLTSGTAPGETRRDPPVTIPPR